MLGALVSALLLRQGLFDTVIFTAVTGVAALLPDLDLRKSKASQALALAAFGCALLLAYRFTLAAGKGWIAFAEALAVILLSLLALDWYFRPRHRTITHSWAAALALAIVCFFLSSWPLALAAAIGYGSHIALDRRVT